MTSHRPLAFLRTISDFTVSTSHTNNTFVSGSLRVTNWIKKSNKRIQHGFGKKRNSILLLGFNIYISCILVEIFFAFRFCRSFFIVSRWTRCRTWSGLGFLRWSGARSWFGAWSRLRAWSRARPRPSSGRARPRSRTRARFGATASWPWTRARPGTRSGSGTASRAGRWAGPRTWPRALLQNKISLIEHSGCGCSWIPLKQSTLCWVQCHILNLKWHLHCTLAHRN